MSRKEAPTEVKRPRGRPPRAPLTAFGKWIDSKGVTTEECSALLRTTAIKLGYQPDHAPAAPSICELRNGRYTPSPLVMLIIEKATKGEIGLAQWVTIEPDFIAPSRRVTR